jgi:DNA-binding GntR family transcriptional regulator
MDERIRQKSLAEHIVEDLERKIIDGTLKPGQRLIEQTLCDTFGVSRAPVREAFQMLENQGFVVREPRKGVSVAKATREEAEDIYRIRASLEGLATALAIQKRTPEFLHELKEMHERMILAAERKDIAAYQALNQTFHELIISACQNLRLVHLIKSFDKQTLRYRMAITNAPGWMEKSTRFHAATIASFETGDAEAAERIRRDSILTQIGQFRELFKNEGAS